MDHFIDLIVDARGELRDGKFVGQADSEFKRFNLEVEVLQEKSSAGGNPLVRLMGTKENIRSWMILLYCGATSPELNRITPRE